MTGQLDGQETLFAPDLWSGKTSPEHSAATKARTSGQFSTRLSGSRSRPLPTFHALKNGRWQMPILETDGPLPTAYSTHGFGECPSVAVVSRLSQILEDTPHPKYYLSAKACLGILRRAEKRGKELPEVLRTALIRQSQSA
ncbi:MAG: hypothetical protein DELT_03230 [Desulfovibrio sp.]